MMRLSPPDPAALTQEQRRVYDMIASGPRGKVRGPLAIWLHRPDLAQKAQNLGAYCRYGSALEPRLSELAILCMAVHWQSEFEWWAHKPIALKAGLEPDLIEALRLNQPPRYPDAESEIICELVFTLNRARKISDALYDRAAQVLGKERLVDLIGLCGYYTLISMTINVFEVPLPAGERAELTNR